MTTNKFSYRLINDDCAINPREWDNVGQLALYPNRYLNSELDINDLPSKDEVIMMFPLRFYSHSGISFSISSGYPYNDAWDSGKAGYVIVTREQVKKLYGNRNNTPDFRAELTKAVRAEIDNLNAYMNGDCWAYVIYDNEDGSGNVLDSCGGYYSYKDAENEAKSQIEYLVQNPIQPMLFDIEPIINKLEDIYC